MPLKTFDPKGFTLAIKGIPLTGYADGSFIVVERVDPIWQTFKGGRGQITRFKTESKTGVITVTLAQSSASNDVLTVLALVDENTSVGIWPIAVADVNGTTAISGNGWIRGFPQVSAGKEVTTRDWVFDVGDMKMYVGGNTIVGAA